ncbi:MAG: hypothetical protein LH679_10635 [Cyanobacteria bacterium CAN_BIN43]|nr:hypothetical protein [Cyanobacteria bacterium CAN_BIN43]
MPPIKEESSKYFWQTEARAKSQGGLPKRPETFRDMPSKAFDDDNRRSLLLMEAAY